MAKRRRRSIKSSSRFNSNIRRYNHLSSRRLSDSYSDTPRNLLRDSIPDRDFESLPSKNPVQKISRRISNVKNKSLRLYHFNALRELQNKVCRRRKERREVLHAKRKGGSGHAPPKYNFFSKFKC